MRKHIQKAVRSFVMIATLLWSLGIGSLIPTAVFAASSIAVTNGQINGNFPDAPVPASSPALSVLRVSVTASQAGQTLASVTVNFGGTGLTQSAFAAIATGNTSGVALYNDAGGTPGAFDGTDAVITLAATPGWTATTTNITLTPATPPTLTNGAATFFHVAIKTSGTITNEQAIIPSVPASGVVTTDGSGPAALFTANRIKADTAPAQITGVSAFVGSPTVNVMFNKPVQKVGGGNLMAGDTPFTYTKAAAANAKTITTINHNAGQNMATLTFSVNIEAADVATGTASTLAAGSNKIADMGGNVIGDATVILASPLGLTTPVIPTATVGTVYNNGAPLVTLAASGGTAPYTFAANAAADTTTLSNAGLEIYNNAGTYIIRGTSGTGAVANIPGSHNLNLKVTDSTGGTPLTATRFYSLNIAPAGGGGVPGIAAVNPGGGPQNTNAFSVTITGSNTHFSNSSAVQFLSSGTNDTNITATVSTASATSLTLSVNIGASATVGPHDVKITTGAEIAILPNAFGIFASGGSGLTLQLPTDAATSVQIPPGFSFIPSTDATINSYRITVKSTSGFSGAALWDYAFPKPADGQNSNGSHCGPSICGLGYGAGSFRIITQPSPLAPNTTYYWQVRTYAVSADTVSDATTPVENTVVRSFTTTASVTDTVPPTIMHRPVFQATASTNLEVFARVNDNIATLTTTPALTTVLLYCAGSGCTPTTSVNGASVGSGYFKYTIPSGTISTAGTIVRYFLRASDGTNTANFKSPDGTTPFQLASVAAGAVSIAGLVRDSAGGGTCPVGVQSAIVFAEGTGFSATTDGSCAYTLSNLFAGNYDLVAVKEAYADRIISGIPTGATGINFSLTSGGGGGFGGDTSKPMVMFTGPMDGMTNMPGSDSNFKIMAAFNKAMSQSTITSSNLTVKQCDATGCTTDITSRGAWIYYSTAPTVAGLPPQANLAAWSLTAGQTLGENKTIAVVIGAGVTDTAGNAIQGNESDGSYSFSFTTSSTATFIGFNSTSGTFADGAKFGEGAFVPPHVTGSTPPQGSSGVPVNTKVVLNFSDPLASDDGGYVLKSFIKLFTVNGLTLPDVSSLISTVTLDTAKTNATVTFASNLTTNTKYRLTVLGGAKAATGITLAPPNQSANVMFSIDFATSTSNTGDVGAPSILGIFPDNAATGVPTTLGAVSIGFSKDMDSSTITSSTITLAVGSTNVNGTLTYRGPDRQVLFSPSTALSPNTTYTLSVTTGVKALNGTALTTAVTRTFTTGAADTTAPGVSFVNADDYNLAITFTKPMNAAKATDSLNFAASVIKPGNYTVKYAVNPADPATGTVITIPATATFSYDPANNTVIISGYHESVLTGLQDGTKSIYISISAVKDIAGNAIGAGNTGKAPIADSATTKGALGPGATNTASMTGGFTPTNFAAGTFGFAPPVEVRPFNTMAGKSTIYGMRLPISKQIEASGSVVVTFPVGFDVSGAKQDVNSPMRTDLNGPGTGTLTFKCNANVVGGKSCAVSANANDTGAAQGGLADDGVVVDTNARSVTIYLSAATNTAGHDFLTIDVDGIKNSTVPKDFNTSGYTADVKTKNASGVVLESLSSMPFFIQSAGTSSLTGTITAAGATSGTATVYLMSPMTGPLSTTSATFDGGTAAYTFSNIPNGQYMLFTDQTVALSADYVGKSSPDPVTVSGASTYNFTLTAASGGTTVTVNITGAPANEPVDVFASSPLGFRVKSLTLDGAGAGTATLNLPNGMWFLGMGPQMPKGTVSSAPPMPNYVMPKPKQITVTSPNCTVEGAANVNCGTAIAFTLATANKTIKGVVKDGAGKIIANAEIYAYSPQGGVGTRAASDTTGLFTLKVTDGSYIVGSFVPGMPPSKEVPVIVTSHATTYILIDGAQTAITPAAAATAFVLRVAKPDYTITGKVTDGTNVVQGASVFAHRTDGPGGANAMTDSSGSYTLYVSAGNWSVGAFLPQYGQLAEQTVTISTASATLPSFSPAQTGNGTFRNIMGTITSGGAPVLGAFVRINGNNTSNQAPTDAAGAYSVKVPEGNGYSIKAFIPNVGEVLPDTAGTFNVSGADVTRNFTVTTPRTITVNFSATLGSAFVDFVSTTGAGNHLNITNAATGALTMPAGSYQMKVNIPGMVIGLTDIAGAGYDNTTGILTVAGGNLTLTVTLPTLRTITGKVWDGTTNLANAWVEITNPTTGVHFGVQTDTTAAPGANFSLKVADGTYFINAMKPGFFLTPVQLVVNGATPAQTLTLGTAEATISGQILIAAAGAPNAFVRAERQGGGFAGTQADANGNYTLSVNAGIWKVYAVADGYQEAALSTSVDTTLSSATLKNITLTSAVTLTPPQSMPLTPATGGTFEDTDAGIKITIPANAFGTGTSAGTIEVKETTNVSPTSTAQPVSAYDGSSKYTPAGKTLAFTDSTGQAVTNFDNPVTVEMTYTKAEITATKSGTDTSINTKAEADKLSMSYWDSTNQNWSSLPSTVSYKDADGAVLTSPAADLSDVATVTIAASTTHFSSYAPVSSTDPSAPSTPTGLAAAAASSTAISLSWTVVAGATGYDIYRSTTSGGTYSRLGSEPTVSSGATVSYYDNGLSAATAYYYKISALNAAGESAASAAVNATTQTATPGGGGSGGNLTSSPSNDTPAPETKKVSKKTTKAKKTAKAKKAIPAPVVETPQPLPAPKALPTVTKAGPAFSRDIFPGSRGTDVVALQNFLIANGFLKLAPGETTGFYGPKTKQAMREYQKSVGIQQTGNLGPLTRAKIGSTTPQAPAEVKPGSPVVETPKVPPAVTKAGPAFSRDIFPGSRGTDVVALQDFLIVNGFLKLAPGETTGFYGPKTKQAMREYQKSVSIQQTGNLGPLTRAKISSDKPLTR